MLRTWGNALLTRLGPLGLLLTMIMIITLYRLWVVTTDGLNLYVDEAQYWYWAQHLAWGYYSKPPVIAAIIALTTSVCGDGESCVRAGSLLLYPLSTGILYLLAQRLFDTRTALLAALVFLTLPAVSLSSLLISTDVALFLFWTLALYAFVRALASNAWADWWLLGAALGLGMLSKYTMGIFFVSALLYLLWEKQWQVLRNPRAWAAVGFSMLLFMPNLVWNWQYHFPTFQHTAEIAVASKQGLVHWDELGEFIGGQFGVFGLVLFPLFIWVMIKGQVAHKRLLLSFALPFLLIISLQAWLGRANANWAAPTYVSATLLVVAWLRQHQRWLLGALVANLLLGLLIYHPAPLNQLMHTDLQKRLKGWDSIGQQYLAIQHQYPAATLLADDRLPLSALAYYARPYGVRGVSWNPQHQLRNHYDLVTSMDGRQGQDFLFVTETQLPPEIPNYFATITPLPDLYQQVHARHDIHFKVYLLQGFKEQAGS